MNNSDLFRFKPVVLGETLLDCFRGFEVGTTYLLRTGDRWRVGKFKMDFSSGLFGFMESNGDLWRIRYESDLKSISCAFIIDDTLYSIKKSEDL